MMKLDTKGRLQEHPNIGGGVNLTGEVVANDFLKMSNNFEAAGRSHAEVRSDLNIEDGATKVSRSRLMLGA